jgi:hypothetical protein
METWVWDCAIAAAHGIVTEPGRENVAGTWHAYDVVARQVHERVVGCSRYVLLPFILALEG